jgi:hypothetical protein
MKGMACLDAISCNTNGSENGWKHIKGEPLLFKKGDV